MRTLIVLLVILGIFGGGYFVYWNKKADDFKQMIVSSVDALNEDAKSATNNKPLITYEAISATGFPFGMVLEMSKPVVALPVTEILKKSPSGTGTAPATSEWVEELSYNDKVTITGNISGDQYTVTASGDRTNRSLIDGKPRHSWTSSSSTPLVWHLQVEQPRGTTPWTMQPIFSDAKTFLHIFRSFDSDVGNETFKDEKGDPLYSFERFHISLVNEDAGRGNHKLALKLDFDKAKATPAFDGMYKDYLLMFFALVGDQQGIDKLPVSLSEAGEKNVEIDVAYEGPTEEKSFEDSTMDMHFDINTFKFQSALLNTDMQAHIASIPQGNDRTITIGFHSQSDASEAYDKMIREIMTSVVAELANPAGKSSEEAQLAQVIATLGTSPAEIVAAVIPESHPLGNTAFDLDLNIRGPIQRSEFMKTGSVTLDNLNWVATPYGFKIKGSVKAGGGGGTPVGDISFNCLSCDALIGDLGGYGMRVEGLADKAFKAKPYLTKDLLDGVKQFLHGISENANAKDLVIHVAVNDSGFTISGKQLPEVQTLYMSTIAPRLPQLAPAAGTSPEPSPMPRQ